MSDADVPGVVGLFDALAPTYDRSGVDFFQPIAAGLLERMAVRPGERWLDVGCGPGAVLLRVAEAVGPRGEAVGIDISAPMVGRARDAAVERGMGNVRVEVGDAAAPPVDGRFDAVTSSLVLFFLDDPAEALRAWWSVLAPGGRLGIVTFGPFDERLEDVESVFEPYLPSDLRDPQTVEESSPFQSDDGVEGLVSGAGFVAVRTDNLVLPVRFASADQWHTFSWSVGQRAMWLAVPEGQRPAVKEEAFRRFAGYAEPDGSATFGVGVRYTFGQRPA